MLPACSALTRREQERGNGGERSVSAVLVISAAFAGAPAALAHGGCAHLGAARFQARGSAEQVDVTGAPPGQIPSASVHRRGTDR